jgi:hypothetical protein
MEFKWINIRDKLITQELLDEFKSGNSVFDEFLREKAGDWQDFSEAATYVFVTTDDIEAGKIDKIYGYASINATGLLYDNDRGEKQYLSCAEIRMFAIHKSLHKRHDPGVKFSKILFTMVLQNLYVMSTHDIGFRAIFLNSNDQGYSLYKECGFSEVSGYLTAETEDKLDIEGTKPLIMFINEGITDLLFV